MSDVTLEQVKELIQELRDEILNTKSVFYKEQGEKQDKEYQKYLETDAN